MNLFGSMLGSRVAQGIGVNNPMVGRMFSQFGSDLFSGKNPMEGLKAGVGQAGAGGMGNALMGIMGLKYGNTSTLGGTLGTALSAYQLYGFLKGGGIASGMTSLGAGIQGFGNMIGSSTISSFGAGMAGTAMPASVAAASAPAGVSAAQHAAFLEANGVVVAEGAAGTAASAGATTGSVMSTAAAYGAGIIGGHYLGRAISGGFSAFGGSSGNSAVNAGTAIGAMIGGPLGALIGGAVGGLVNRLFGSRKSQVAGGVTGTLASGGQNELSGYQTIKTEYGFFRFKSNDYNDVSSTLDPEVSSAFNKVTKDLTKSVKSLGRMFDFNLSKFNETYTESIKLDFQNAKTEEERMQIISDAFQKFGSNLVNFAFGSTGIAKFAQAGEDNLETITRLATGREAWKTLQGVFPEFTNISKRQIGDLFGVSNFGTPADFVGPLPSSKVAPAAIANILGISPTSAQLDTAYADYLAGGRGMITSQEYVMPSGKVSGSGLVRNGIGLDASLITEDMLEEMGGYLKDITVSLKDAITLYTADLTSKLVEEFGGKDEFNTAMNKYVDLFYTADEKLQMQKDVANNALTDAMEELADLGLSNLPQLANTVTASANNYRQYVDDWLESVGGFIGIDTDAEREKFKLLTIAGETFMNAAQINLQASENNANNANTPIAQFVATNYLPILDEYGRIVNAANTPGLAGGGIFSSRKPFVVGEVGPEIMIPNFTGTIVPTHTIIDAVQSASSLDSQTRNLLETASPRTDSVTQVFLNQNDMNRNLSTQPRDMSVTSAVVDNSVRTVSSPRTNIISMSDDVRSTHPVAGIFTRAMTSART